MTGFRTSTFIYLCFGTCCVSSANEWFSCTRILFRYAIFYQPSLHLCASTQKFGFPVLTQERHASNKIHHHSRQNRKPPGVKRLEGEYVRQGEVLVVQNVLKFHPGLNVDIQSNRTLRSLRDGKVIITCEKINPTMDNPVAMRYYEDMPEPEIYKRYFHVIPFKQSMKFNLVDLI